MLRYYFGAALAPTSVFIWGCGALATHLDRWRALVSVIPRLHWRTPILRDYVQRLTLNPTATARQRGPMLQRARA